MSNAARKPGEWFPEPDWEPGVHGVKHFIVRELLAQGGFRRAICDPRVRPVNWHLAPGEAAASFARRQRQCRRCKRVLRTW